MRTSDGGRARINDLKIMRRKKTFAQIWCEKMGLSSENYNKIVHKLEDFMCFCQRVNVHDSYLIVNRNSPLLAEAAEKAALNCRLDVRKFNLDSKKPYDHFPKELITLLRHETPKAGVGLFDYSNNPDWNLKEVGARIELLHHTIEQVPISWAHSPGITLDMAINGPLQCDYKKMAEEAEKIMHELQSTRKFHITAPSGTDIEVEVPSGVKFDTDCIIVPPNVYGKLGKFGNLPVGEVWLQNGKIVRVLNKETGKMEEQNYPIKQEANGKIVCDITVGGYPGRIDAEKPLVAKFQHGILTELQCDDPALDKIQRDIMNSEAKYGLPTVLEEVGIGLNEKARVTGNMLEDEKIRGTCHLAPGNIRSHVDMLVDKPTIISFGADGAKKEIMKNGVFV